VDFDGTLEVAGMALWHCVVHHPLHDASTYWDGSEGKIKASGPIRRST